MDRGLFGALGYPLTGDGAERPLLACWILLLLVLLVPPLAVVPLVPFCGYVVRVVVASARGDSAPRVLEAPGRLVRQGVAGIGITVGFLLGPMVAMLVTLRGATDTAPESGLSLIEGLILYGGSTAVLCLMLVAVFVFPIGLAIYGEANSVRAVMNPSKIRSVAVQTPYFTRWTAGVVALVVAIALGNVVVGHLRAGTIVAALLFAYGTVFAAHVWGVGIRRAREW